MAKIWNNFKSIYCWVSKVKDNKFQEFQIMWYFYPTFDLCFDFSIHNQYKRSFDINIFNLVEFGILKDKECNHAGLSINFKLIGLEIEFINRDTRHWDDLNNKWEEIRE